MKRSTSGNYPVKKTIYVYEPKLPPKERYRIYRDAILIVGDPGHTGKIALMLMNNESIDPLHTLILEITRNVLSNIDSKLWDFIDLVVDTDRTGDTGSIMDIKKRENTGGGRGRDQRPSASFAERKTIRRRTSD